MKKFSLTIPYRDKSLKKYTITMEGSFHTPGYVIRVDFIAAEKYECTFVIKFSDTWFRMHYGQEEIEHMLLLYGDSPLIRSIIYDQLYKKSLHELDGQEIFISRDTQYANKIKKDESGILNMEVDSVVFATQNKLAREIVLTELYEFQNARGSAPWEDLIEQCHYFRLPIENGIKALIDREFLDNDGSNLSLTYKGQNFVEEKILSPFNDRIFLIAACQDDIIQMISKVYRPAVKELGYELIFQEENEPRRSIHDEIWEGIEESELILCDFTHERPNCFIEYGYALAKNKQIILCIEEKQGKTKSGKYLKIAFDTLNQRYSFWKSEWLIEKAYENELIIFKDKIKERIREKIAKLDLQSEI